MTQPQLIAQYIRVHGSIVPAKMGGQRHGTEFFGSETSKRCRELRAKGILRSEGEGRFERFYFHPDLKGKVIDLNHNYLESHFTK